jgi:hypothetical protein
MLIKKNLILLLGFSFTADCIVNQTFLTLKRFSDTEEVNLEVLLLL